MIIVKLTGGLGNQMFQYAFARRIAHNHKALLKLDILGFESYKLHKYSLGAFNIREDFASPEETRTLMVQTHIREKKKFHFDPEMLKLPDNVYLEGSWQSEKYFANINSVIRQEFRVKTPQTGKDKKLAEQIASCQSVNLHVRRGDYISDPQTNQVHGNCSLDYYFRCIEYLRQKVKNPHFFIFSDDPEWAGNNLKLSYPMTLVNHNKANKNYEDLRLMSQCKHHIIANSTFSWWGAWLNQNPRKIVLAPKRWFRNNDYNPKDLIPDKWIKV